MSPSAPKRDDVKSTERDAGHLGWSRPGGLEHGGVGHKMSTGEMRLAFFRWPLEADHEAFDLFLCLASYGLGVGHAVLNEVLPESE